MIAPPSAGVFSVLNEFCWMIGRLPMQLPSDSPCASTVPKKDPDEGASAVTLTVYSPVLLVENACPGLVVPWTGMVPLKVSVTFFDGSTTPPQARVTTLNNTAAHAATAV